MLTEATISRHTRTLVTLGLLTKEKDITNKKSYNLKLTSAGVNAFTRAKKVIMKELDVSFSHITQVDKKIIMSNFTKSTSLLQ